MTDNAQKIGSNTLQLVIIAALVVGAFLGAYKFASARTAAGATNAAIAASSAQAASAAPATAGGSTSSGSGQCGSGSGCCCGGGGSSASTSSGVTGAPVEGTAQVSGGVQVIAVKVGTTYSPNIITLKAGIPAEITFGQGAGCTGQVVSADLGFREDLTSGPKVVKLPPLKAGTYSFSCGMGMVFGKIVVQ